MSELVLGGAQFGLLYGISNKSGCPIQKAEAAAIISCAKENGIIKIDTASVYGDSESVIGEAIVNQSIQGIQIITKAPSLFKAEQIGGEQISQVKVFFAKSIKELRQKSIYGLMCHQADDLLKPNADRLYALLCELKQQGLVEKIGCSFYSKQQIEQVLEKFPLDIIQVPVSIFDQRLIENDFLQNLSSKIEIYARSIFLQGLVFLEVNELPKNIINVVSPYLNRFKNYCKQEKLSEVELALSFFKDKPYLKLVVGVTSQRELLEIINATQKIKYSKMPLLDFREFAVNDAIVLNPSLWGDK